MSRPGDSELRVERAAASLSPLEREVLVLNAGHHWPIERIAAKLGIPEHRAQRLLATGLAKFDRELNRREQPWWRFWR